MSVAGGWFFLMACEMFVLGSRDFRLPGLGSYLQTAASAGDATAILWGVGAMIMVIVLLDQLVCVVRSSLGLKNSRWSRSRTSRLHAPGCWTFSAFRGLIVFDKGRSPSWRVAGSAPRTKACHADRTISAIQVETMGRTSGRDRSDCSGSRCGLRGGTDTPAGLDRSGSQAIAGSRWGYVLESELGVALWRSMDYPGWCGDRTKSPLARVAQPVALNRRVGTGDRALPARFAGGSRCRGGLASPPYCCY